MHFYALARLRLRRALAKKGFPRNQIDDIIADCANDVIDSACEMALVKPPVGQLGDGTIIKLILDFLSSEAGQKLIDALIKLLLGLI